MRSRTLKLGVVMDPIGAITPKKDSTLAMLLEAMRRDIQIHYFEQADLKLDGGRALGRSRRLEVFDDNDHWYRFGDADEVALGELDVILMRKDPPFDMEYVYTTYLLDRARIAGALVVNRPQALRDMNEKAYLAWFESLAPKTLITRSIADMRAFLAEQGEAAVKPLEGMGGKSVFIVKRGDKNANVIFETLTQNGTRFAMAQAFIPEIAAGDKRILLIDGQAVPHALARIPPEDDNRGNLVMGATGKGQPLSDRDRAICAEVGPALKRNGVLFAGIDVIGDYLTEVNVTSPTGIRELDRLFDLNIAGQLFDAIETHLEK